MSLRKLFAMIAALGAAVAWMSSGTLAAAAYSSGGVSAGPLHWDPSNPDTRSYYIPTVSPGGTFSDQIRVQNPNSDAVELYVNAVDGITAIPSGAVYANRTDLVRKWGAWVTPGVSSLVVGAHQEALVTFTVRVPSDASPGDHLAGVAFENAHPTSGSGSIDIASVVRTVVGVLVKVPGPAAFHMTISGASIQPLSIKNLSSVVITLTDDGLLLGRPLITVTLAGPGGYHKTVSHQFDTILPGDTIPLPFPWPDNLAPGDYTITIEATAPGMQGSATYQGTAHLGTPLTGVPTPAPAPQAHNESGAGTTTPWWVVPLIIGSAALLLILGGLGILIAVLLRRQRRDKAAEKEAAKVAR